MTDVSCGKIVYFEWKVAIQADTLSQVSENFTFQDSKCNLEINKVSTREQDFGIPTGSVHLSSELGQSEWTLYFISTKKPDRRIEVILDILKNDNPFCLKREYITDKEQEIWNYTEVLSGGLRDQFREFNGKKTKDFKRAAFTLRGCKNGTGEINNGHPGRLNDSKMTFKIIFLTNILKGEKSTQADLVLSFGAGADENCLSQDFGELLEKGYHSDVQLVCKDGNIPAHRAILSARSKKFLEMFQDPRESRHLEDFTDTELSVMKLCLEFIYKGEISNLPFEKTSSVYVLGLDLEISSLTEMCADLMVSHLSRQNYLTYLMLSDERNDGYFKRGIIDYISKNIELLKSDSWIDFSDQNLKIANEVHRKCLLKYV